MPKLHLPMNLPQATPRVQDVDGLVMTDQVNALEGNLAVSLIGSALQSLLIAVVFRGESNHNLLFGWCALQFAFSGYGWWAGRKPGRRPTSPLNAKRRLQATAKGALISGLLWSAGAVWMWSSDSIELRMLSVLLITGMVANSLASQSAYLPALLGFVEPCVGTLTLVGLWHGGLFGHVVAIGAASYGFVTWRYGRQLNRVLLESFRRRHEIAELAAALQVQKELAEAAALAKSRFLAAASHDLRQPMHALNLYLGAFDHFDLPDAARPAMASARECAQTMDEMFRALLDISKLDASSMQTNISTFAIAPLLEKIKNGFVQQAQAKGLDLRVAHSSAFVASDPELLERVLANLVSNAVRYTENGKILLGCRRTESGLRVGVYDTGPGIAADQQRAVFEEFYQVGNPERDRAQGLGLGLAIVQRLGILLKAPLALSSQVGKGSVFSIEVPRAVPQSAPPLEVVSALPGQHGTLQGALIAVIDDEPQILDATALVLRQWGCTVITAASGAEAVERLSLSDRAPDVIVCDHRLRGTETGVDVIAALRVEFNLEIPALLITGDTSPQRIQSMAVTGIPVLNKPLQDHVLLDALLRLLNQLPVA